MLVLGIHEGHNSSACLLKDGQVVSYLQEERLSRIKNKTGFPVLAIKRILKDANINVLKLDAIAFAGISRVYSFSDENRTNSNYSKETWAKLIISCLKQRLYFFIRKTRWYKNRKKKKNLKERLGFFKKNIGLPSATCFVDFFDHHLSHAASAFYLSGFHSSGEDTLILTLDGAGDGLCATVNVGRQTQINRIAETEAGNSIGNLYSAVTKMLGFNRLEHEYKLMGMAPYSSKKYSDECKSIFMKYLTVTGLTFKRLVFEPTDHLCNRLFKDFKYKRFDSICGGLQSATEQLVIEWVKNALSHTGIKKVVLGGGVFMNVKVNKAISELDIKNLFVMPSCGDESNACGAAFLALNALDKENLLKINSADNIYWGTFYSDDEILSQLNKVGNNIKFSLSENIEDKVAELLSDGQIVARFKGRMEFGARALGNRSILANPSNKDSVRIINHMIKKRDFWMPFAPLMIKEDSDKYICNEKKIDSPFMMLCFDTKSNRAEIMAAVHNADFTARAQIVTRKSNPDLYDLVASFKAKTGLSVVLNTSFNLHGYPLVESPSDAIDVFNNSGLRYLALGNYLVSKNA